MYVHNAPACSQTETRTHAHRQITVYKLMHIHTRVHQCIPMEFCTCIHIHTCIDLYNMHILIHTCIHMYCHTSVYLHTWVCTQEYTHAYPCVHGSRRVSFGVLYKCTHACKFIRKQSPASQCLRKHMVPLNSHPVCPSLQAQGARVWQTHSVPCCSNPCRSTPTCSRSSGLPSYSCILREVWPACGPGFILLNLPSCSKFVSGRDA